MRKYFNVDTYLTQLQASSGITGCDAVPVPDIGENQNYIFISYAHQDYKQVYEDLAVMYHAGVRFWYDRGLTTGTLLNGKRLAPMAICPLNDGDAISAGSQVFVYSHS